MNALGFQLVLRDQKSWVQLGLSCDYCSLGTISLAEFSRNLPDPDSHIVQVVEVTGKQILELLVVNAPATECVNLCWYRMNSDGDLLATDLRKYSQICSKTVERHKAHLKVTLQGQGVTQSIS